MKKLFFIIPFFFFSCISDHPKVKIKNNTTTRYDSIRVFSTPNTPTIFKNIEPGDVLKDRIYFDENFQTDGAYSIQIYNDGKLYLHKSYGYFTNGASLNRKIKFRIEPDTLIVSFK